MNAPPNTPSFASCRNWGDGSIKLEQPALESGMSLIVGNSALETVFPGDQSVSFSLKMVAFESFRKYEKSSSKNNDHTIPLQMTNIDMLQVSEFKMETQDSDLDALFLSM